MWHVAIAPGENVMVQMSAINHISGAQGSAVMCASTPNVISENRLITGNNLEKYFHWPHPSGGATATAAAAGETVQIQAACVAYHWLLQVNQLFLVDSYYIKAGDHGQQGISLTVFWMNDQISPAILVYT